MLPSGLLRSFTFPASCLLVGGICASLALSFWAYRHEQRIEQADFERRAQFRVAAVEEGVLNAVAALQVVNQLFVTNGSVSREQFHSFTQPLHARYPFIEAFAFNRLVSKTERPAFEAQRRSRYPGFMITEMVDGKRISAAIKDSYRVIDYIEPMAGHEVAFGLDASSRPFQDEATQRATDTGLPAATGLYPIFRDKTGTERGFILQMAVYQGGTVPENVASRRRAVVGYTVALLRPEALFQKILTVAGTRGNAGLDIRVYAAASADESKLVFSSSSLATKQQENGWSSWWLRGIEPRWHSFNIANTKWHMVITYQQKPFTDTYASALLALVLGLLATVAATAYLRTVTLRTQRVEQLVTQRTTQLQQVNSLLIDSEERASEMAQLSSDWFWELDEHFHFTRHSLMASEKDRQGSSVLLGTSLWEMPVDPDAVDWGKQRARLEAHQPFRDFEYKRLVDGSSMQWLSASGKPLFDADGNFKGYRGTARNIHARKQAEQALRDSQFALRQLTSHLQQVREDERKRIARDIHDDLGQNLMVLRIDVARMASRSDSSPLTAERIAAALRQVDMTIKALRAILNDLRPTALDLGLPAALEWQATEFAQRTGIACQLQVDDDNFALDEQCATALFRIAQEALSNVVRHARASRVQINLQCTDGQLKLTIVDDGIGLDTNGIQNANRFGLLGMKERTAALGGTLSILSHPGQGTMVILSVPLQADTIGHSQVVG